jgi:two-component system response regulator YesN
MSFRWVYNEDIFSELLNLTKQTNANPLQIKNLFYQLTLSMGRIEMYRLILKDEIKDMDHFHYWADWRKWVEDIRELIKQGNGHVYAEEIVSSIMKALEIVQQNLGDDITRDDIANRVSMSKAYFSLCFKDIIGVAFGDYVKDLRLKRAHELLLQTQKPIYWVAEQCGFKDEKYFSKLFREHLGILPNELRKH